MDELSLSNNDMRRMDACETSELEETLAWLRQNTAMTLAALSSTSLLDRGTVAANVSQPVLDEMIARTGFAAVSLKHIMRSSQNIAAATSPASLNWAQPDPGCSAYKIPETISPGSSSTVPGTRPRAWVYRHTEDVDYTKLAGFVTHHLRTLDIERLKCVVLTDNKISARELSDQLQRLNMPVSCYDAGVKIFEKYPGTPICREGGAGDGGEVELTAWLRSEGGVLVTHEVQFRGAEADFIILVTKAWAGNYSTRSPVTRAVAGLLLITGDLGLRVRGLRKHWEVTILEERARPWQWDGGQ